jgi:hypothetical protein
MSKQHYQVSTYKAQLSIGYLVKRAHSLMLDIMEPVIEQRGFSFVQYVVMSSLRDGIAVNPKAICAQFRHDSGALTRNAVCWSASGAIAIGARWNFS